MQQIDKLYALVEPEPSAFYRPWFQNSENLKMDGNVEVKEGHRWFEFAKWAAVNRETAQIFFM